MGFEISDGHYVTFDKDELDDLRPTSTKMIDVSDFVALDDIDPIYYERTYWLAPDGDAAARAYQLLLAAMEDRERVAIGSVAMRNKQYLVAIRPLDGVLAMSTMRFADEVVPRKDIDELPSRRTKPAPKELAMAVRLLDSLATDWNPKQYKDTYVDELRARITAKEAGKEIAVEEPDEHRADVIDLSEALQRSLDEARGGKRRKPSRPQTTQECVTFEGDPTTYTLGQVSASISVRGVTKFFGRLEALRLIDLDVAPGEVVTVLGASGSGKTTLLRLIGGLAEPSSGLVEVDGASPHEARDSKRVGFVPQSPALLPWRTVARNASLLLEVNRDATSDAARSPAELLAEVGLAEFADAYPHELSGGMQQRVALVRAMTLGAPLLLMDEPFAALDEITREDMRHLLARLCESLPTTVVFVTHSVPESVYLSDRVVVLSQRPGRIVGIEQIDLPRPRQPDVEDDPAFFAATKRLRALLHEGAALHWTPAV